MKDPLVAWFHGHQDRVNLSGELVCEAAQQMLDKLYSDHDRSFKFSNSWLESFKKRHKIRSHWRFRESGSVNKQIINESLPRLRETLDKFEWKYIYNMNDIGLFFWMQVFFTFIKFLGL